MILIKWQYNGPANFQLMIFTIFDCLNAHFQKWKKTQLIIIYFRGSLVY